ncbi:hypothetical protein D083_1623 [Dickeya solani RNS 08.23.3.1.A]|nr:hypothetical protein D083_1623 [Dickeya solani RNS 08.23.3.1.A]
MTRYWHGNACAVGRLSDNGGAARMCIADFDEYRVKYQPEV